LLGLFRAIETMWKDSPLEQLELWLPDVHGHGRQPAESWSGRDWNKVGAQVSQILDDVVASHEGVRAGNIPVVGFGHSMGGAGVMLAQ